MCEGFESVTCSVSVLSVPSGLTLLRNSQTYLARSPTRRKRADVVNTPLLVKHNDGLCSHHLAASRGNRGERNVRIDHPKRGSDHLANACWQQSEIANFAQSVCG